MDSIPYGLCKCGCGSQTLPRTTTRCGWKQGDPCDFIKGHSQRVRFAQTLEDRFIRKVDQSGGPDACWPWMGSRSPFGYGSFSGGETGSKAHRFAYALWNGPIPEGLWVLHACDNPPCCNPKHLHLGTATDNMRERSIRGRAPTGNKNGSRMHPEKRQRGEKHPDAVLTDQDARLVKIAVAGGISQRYLANLFGVSTYTIWAIIHGRTWKHIA